MAAAWLDYIICDEILTCTKLSCTNIDFFFSLHIGQPWDTNNPMTVTLGSSTAPINKMVAVCGKIWCGCQNNILVVEPNSLNVEVRFITLSFNNRPMSHSLLPSNEICVRADQKILSHNQNDLKDKQINPTFKCILL